MTALNLLVVEDNAGDLCLLKEMLESSQLCFQHVYEASNLAEAAGMLADQEVDIVLLDLSIPGTEGIESYFSIRKANAVVPVIVLSGMAYMPTIPDLIRHGIKDYLIKGEFHASELATSILQSIQCSAYIESGQLS